MWSIHMRENQFGPISYIRTAVAGYACTSCEFATYEASEGEPLCMREHWQQHANKEPGLHDPLPRRTDLQSSAKFRRCMVPSFDYDQAHFLWLSIPQAQLAKTAANPLKSFMQLLIAGLEPPKFAPDTPGPYADPKAVLPFCIQNHAFELASSLPPDHVTELISLPGKKGDPFHKLKLATVQRFQRLCDQIPDIAALVRRLLIAPKP